MTLTLEYFSPKPNYPTYPPYHQGLYLEDYFMEFLTKNRPHTSRYFIPVSWTSYYNNGMPWNVLQGFLNSLNSLLPYYVVSQHDDAPAQRLPPNTLVFSAGGNYSGPNCIPIPLICSPITKTDTTNKDIFCSFVGSATHGIRNELFNTFKNDSDFLFTQGGWDIKVSEDKLNHFINTTSKSKFALCPRGYGKSSFRLYETMQLGTVPVYVSDDHYLPWTDELDWNEFCVLVKQKDIGDLKNILLNISTEKYDRMLNKIKQIYNDYFTLEGTCEQIIKRVKL
jgi:hypothetical protein